jgi:hypothetical protein
MRDPALGTSLFVLLLIAVALPRTPGARTEIASAVTRAPRAVDADPIMSGVGFAVCAADTSWRWPSALDQGDEELRAPAVLYDGRGANALPSVTTKTCWTEQPQVFLVGYEAVAYDAQDPKKATLRVRPARGYRLVILTGPIRPEIALIAGRRLDTLNVPAAWVTPIR